MAKPQTLRSLAVGIVVCLLLGATPAHAQTAAPAGTNASVGGVRAGDLIRVWVWRESTLSGDFPVDSRGRVVLPLLGERTVAGEAAEALGDSLRTAFRRFITNPSINVTVLRRISVQGQVAKPGFYPVDATVSVADVIALAGGVSAAGDSRKIRLLRGGQVVVARLGPDAVVERSPVQSGDEIFVPERSFFSRNGVTLLWIAASSAATLLVSTLTR